MPNLNDLLALLAALPPGSYAFTQDAHGNPVPVLLAPEEPEELLWPSPSGFSPMALAA